MERGEPEMQRLWEFSDFLRGTRRRMRFDEFSGVDNAVLQAFRHPGREPPERIILGNVSRESPNVGHASSLVMRAKLYGFYFCFRDRLLMPLHSEEHQEENHSLESDPFGSRRQYSWQQTSNKAAT
jgi:hypothetical protein